MKAIGSPNYFSHDTVCKGSINSACRSTSAIRTAMSADWANARQVVLYGRNVFESIEVKAMNALLDAISAAQKSHVSTLGSPSPPPNPIGIS